MLERKFYQNLIHWKENHEKECLLINGARQVGKTFLVEHFGAAEYASCISINFIKNPEYKAIFEGPLDPSSVIKRLSLQVSNARIVPRSTLLFLDEIQACRKARTALKFLALDERIDVIASGSLLGIHYKRDEDEPDSEISIPVGYEREVIMHSLDFEEFLWALGQEKMADGIRSCFVDRRAFVLHDDALDLYRRYLVVGGMPKAVSCYAQNGDYEEIRTLQAEINQTYIADIALYAPPEEPVRIQAVWASIPKQLARETTRKFKYADVSKGGRERQYRAPLAWLEAAELVTLNPQTNDTTAPLVARDGGSFFKAYLLDTGLMFFRYNLDAQTFLDDEARGLLSANFRGALAENYAMQALTANNLETFYWTPGTTAQQEVEFVVQNRRGRIIPIEVKSGDNVRSRSLVAFMDKSKAPCALRLSAKNFGMTDRVFSVPLYAAFCIDEQALMQIG